MDSMEINKGVAAVLVAGIVFFLENLNTELDHPGVPFARASETLALVSAIDSPYLRLNLDLYHATKLAEMVKPYGISFFEEPLTQNDVPGMAQLRRATGMALACGQNEGLAFRFRDLLVNEAIDYAQPNVAITGS